MELLNLDELAEKVKRQVTLQGKTYDMSDRKVGEMVDSIQRVREFEKAQKSGDDLALSEAMARNLIESSQQLLPDCPKEVLENCSMKQLSALLEFANASDADIVEDAKEAEKQAEAETEAGK